jgi:hypothetical protein
MSTKSHHAVASYVKIGAVTAKLYFTCAVEGTEQISFCSFHIYCPDLGEIWYKICSVFVSFVKITTGLFYYGRK